MMRNYPACLLCFVVLCTCQLRAVSQSAVDLNGFWKCYSTIPDTLKENNDCFWMGFDGTAMQTYLSSGTSKPDAVGEKTNYEFKNNVLKTLQGKKIIKLKVTVYHSNFISYTISADGKPETVYLKRELKAH